LLQLGVEFSRVVAREWCARFEAIVRRVFHGWRSDRILPVGRAVGIWLFALSAGSLSTLLISEAAAVLIAGPDGTLNSSAPDPDPGFANVGQMSGLTGVYVRNGWVLTAAHVGPGPILLDGLIYDPIPGSNVRIENPSPPHADLVAFKLEERPPLPDLVIASVPLSANDEVIMIGNGESRGAAMTWANIDGWEHASPRAIRWGTNRVESTNLLDADTEHFETSFSELRGPARNDPEAQSVRGDSGGAAYLWRDGVWELVGILFARGEYEDQPDSTALYGNVSLVADLHAYRAQILAVIDQPDCDDGIDEDGDGLIDYPDDPGCDDPLDDYERTAAIECDNGFDDDLDGFVDFPADDGCADAFDMSEVPEPGFGVALGAGLVGIVFVSRGREASVLASTGVRSFPISGSNP
jgi:Trypsin